MTLNKILIIGNVGRDPEMRYTPNGNPVTSFSVATSRRYTTQGEQREETEWFRVSAWNRLAETCNQYVTKGMKVFVEGRLSSNEWVGQDGEKRFGLDITASEVKFLNRPGDADSGDQGGEGAGGYTPPGPAPNEVEDLPW
jgi:single-strand DNA-binding protein